MHLFGKCVEFTSLELYENLYVSTRTLSACQAYFSLGEWEWEWWGG